MPLSIKQPDQSHPTQVATVNGINMPLGFITFSLTTAQFLPTIASGANYALIQVQGGALNWRDDGVAPSASTGMTIPSGGELVYNGTLSALQLCSQSGTVTVNISFYG